MPNQPKTLSERLTHGYLMVVRDEETFEERISTRLNAARVIVLGFMAFILTFTLAYIFSGIIRDTLGSQNPESLSRQAVLLDEKVDSLEHVILSNEQYVSNIRNILSENIQVDSTQHQAESEVQTKSTSLDELEEISQVDQEFRKSFEGTDTDMSGQEAEKAQLQELVFFPPVRGLVTKNYDARAEHYGVDIVAPKNEPIKAVVEGTVVIASWTQDSGYVIGIQHSNELLSFYKHNSVLLKKVGEFVQAGEPVAIIGNSGEYTDGPHLHFELWYRGDHVNPRAFIKF